MKKIILVGGGGLCKVIIDTLFLENNYKIVGIIDLKEKIGKKVFELSIVGDDSDLENYFNKDIKYSFITAGSIGNPSLRIKLFNKAKHIGFNFPNVSHQSAVVSKFVKFGEGNFIAPGAIVNAGVRIGNNCIINTGAIIDHDCKIDDFVHIAPGVVISGGVEIDKYSHIGTGSSIIQYMKIGKNTIIGAGSNVISDIRDNVIAYGNPCKEIRKNDG